MLSIAASISCPLVGGISSLTALLSGMKVAVETALRLETSVEALLSSEKDVNAFFKASFKGQSLRGGERVGGGGGEGRGGGEERGRGRRTGILASFVPMMCLVVWLYSCFSCGVLYVDSHSGGG